MESAMPLSEDDCPGDACSSSVAAALDFTVKTEHVEPSVGMGSPCLSEAPHMTTNPADVIERDVSLSNTGPCPHDSSPACGLFEADSTVQDFCPAQLFDECTQTSNQEMDFGISLSQISLGIEHVESAALNLSSKEDLSRGNGRSRKRERKQTYQPRIEQGQSDFEFIEVRIPVKTPRTEKDKVSIRCPMNNNTSKKKDNKSKSKTRTNNKENIPPNNQRKKSEHAGMLHETSRQMLNAANWIMQEAHRFSSDASSDDDMEFDEIAMKYEPKHYQETDLATALGIDPLNRTEEKIESRKLSIRQKLRQNKGIAFTLEEEFDIHERAEEYVSHLLPDSNYYRLPSPCLWQHEALYGRHESEDPLSPDRKRKRRSYDNMKCYVTHETCSSRSYLPNTQDNSKILPEGTRLLKPPNKLVELVAQVINNGPDGMLQVQQVYMALQNRYPYFHYMDKSSVTSWRSSIRHALYQKWFRKVSFSTDLISCRGCYWAINRRHTPKEWTMPSRQDNQETARNIEKELMQYADPETAAAVESILYDMPSMKQEAGVMGRISEAEQMQMYRMFPDESQMQAYEHVADPVLPPVDTLLTKMDANQDNNTRDGSSSNAEADPVLSLGDMSAGNTLQEQAADGSCYAEIYQSGSARTGYSSVPWLNKGEEAAYNGVWNMTWEDYHNSMLAYQQPVLPAVYMSYMHPAACVDYEQAGGHLYQPVYGKHMEEQW